MIICVSKENNLGPSDNIRYTWGLRTNFLYLYQMLSFYEIKSFTRALRNMKSVFRNALINDSIS